MSGRKWAGVLAMIVVMSPLMAVGQSSQNQQGLLSPDSEAEDGKRGFRPGRFIEKLIPGGKDRDRRSTGELPGADGAVVVPNPSNATTLPPPPIPQSQMSPQTGGRVPPPPVPASAERVTLAPPSPAPVPEQPVANPFESGPGSTEEERGILGGVANMVGKIIPGGRESEPSPVAEESERSGLLGRMLDRRKEEPNPVGTDSIILPPRPAPTSIPAPAIAETSAPPAAVAVSRPVVAPTGDSSDSIHKQRLTIPLRSGNPDAPVQREERGANSDPVAMERSTIDPVMPASAPQETIKAPAADAIPTTTPEPIRESTTPSLPVSTVVALPPSVEPEPTPQAAIAVPPPPRSTGLMISDSGNSVLPPSVPKAISTPAPAPVSAQTLPSTEGGTVARANERPSSAIAAIDGTSKEMAKPPVPAAVSSSIATTDAPKREAETTGERAITSDSAHFVTIKEGVAGVCRDSSGQGHSLASGTVMRYMGGDDKFIKVRLETGAEGSVETWQLRDATFEEAVDFLKRAN